MFLDRLACIFEMAVWLIDQLRNNPIVARLPQLPDPEQGTPYSVLRPIVVSLVSDWFGRLRVGFSLYGVLVQIRFGCGRGCPITFVGRIRLHISSTAHTRMRLEGCLLAASRVKVVQHQQKEVFCVIELRLEREVLSRLVEASKRG